MSHPSSAVLRDVSFAWPDGPTVLDRASAALGRGRTGLIGGNGSGKSTVLRLIRGRLAPVGGTITIAGTVDHLPQRIAASPRATLADVLGVTPALEAIRAIGRGSTDPVHFDVVADDWDLEERAAAALTARGLPTDLDRTAASLSGGEAVLAAVTGIQLRRADIALLDEPTNNLDSEAREQLYDMVRRWRGTLVVVSHDLALLELMDTTLELRGGTLTAFGGPYSLYRARRDAEQDAVRRALSTAEQALRKEQQVRIKAEERIAHSARQGRKDRANRKFVSAVINDRRNSAEKAQGALRGRADARVAAARAAVELAESALRDDALIRVDLPDPQVPPGRSLAELPSSDGRHVLIRGPQRVALTGSNGVGKTTLLRGLLPGLDARAGYLPQRIQLDEEATVLEIVRRSAPDLAPGEVRNRLARVLIRGAMVDRRAGSLSGGERFRVALAQLLLADPPRELLVLDEPTNDLDIDSVDALVQALAAYRGGLVIVSHDRAFLDRVGLDLELRMEPDGRLTQAR